MQPRTKGLRPVLTRSVKVLALSAVVAGLGVPAADAQAPYTGTQTPNAGAVDPNTGGVLTQLPTRPTGQVSGTLAITGSDVIGITLIGGGFVVAGAALVRRGRRQA